MRHQALVGPRPQPGRSPPMPACLPSREEIDGATLAVATSANLYEPRKPLITKTNPYRRSHGQFLAVGRKNARFQAFLVVLACLGSMSSAWAERPNVLLIVCDDLNDSVEGFGGHPQAKTPFLNHFAASGVRFQRAYSNAPICAPSRASFLTGIYPSTSGNYHFQKWFEIPVLRNSQTLMAHFKANGYHVAGTGKLMHHHRRGEYHEFGQPVDYGPFAFNGETRVAHPSVPKPFQEIGLLDGSFAPLSDVPFGGKNGAGWVVGNWRNPNRPWRYVTDDNRDRTPDEANAQWAADFIRDYRERKTQRKKRKPFFLSVGFIRPHTPMVAPQRFFDLFPLETVKPARFMLGDAKDTGFASAKARNRGNRAYRLLQESYGSAEVGLGAYTQAYLACVAAVDECVGQVLSAVDESGQADNTIVIVTSDHGFNLGEKEYVFKNSLWEESVRVPLIIRVPRLSKAGSDATQPVSLIDLFPTLVDLCDLEGDTRKNNNGRSLDGHSLRPFITDPKRGKWDGPAGALTVVAGGRNPHDTHHFSLRTRRWRYIRYNNGAQELYDHDNDPFEWTNLATSPKHAAITKALYRQLVDVRGTAVPAAVPVSAVRQKWDWFRAVDKNKDGTATEAEWLAWSRAADKRNGKIYKAAQRKKTFRRLDANRDGHLTRSELMKGPQTPGTP
ncbi:MAG: hypothetical protein CMJ59_10690 [Planctomycetaceae bacterium]|nr:hypothetical protein [Planctomycetaceae bacterium]